MWLRGRQLLHYLYLTCSALTRNPHPSSYCQCICLSEIGNAFGWELLLLLWCRRCPPTTVWLLGNTPRAGEEERKEVINGWSSSSSNLHLFCSLPLPHFLSQKNECNGIGSITLKMSNPFCNMLCWAELVYPHPTLYGCRLAKLPS